MENRNVSQSEIDDVREIEIPAINSLRDSEEPEEPFISIYSFKKIEYFFFEIMINTIFIELFGLLVAAYALMSFKYYFFMVLWMFYDFGFAIFIIHQLRQENKY